MLNANIKPTFLSYIAGLEQSDLVALVTDLVDRDRINGSLQFEILKQNGVAVPVDPLIDVIVDHNVKKILISYQANYNGCSVYIKETIDGTASDAYDEEKSDEIDVKVGEAIAEYAYDNGMVSERGKLRASDAEIERVARTIATTLLGEVEIEFEIDNMST